MPDEDVRGTRPRFDNDECDLEVVLDCPRAGPAVPARGGLARLMRVVEAVRED